MASNKEKKKRSQKRTRTSKRIISSVSDSGFVMPKKLKTALDALSVKDSSSLDRHTVKITQKMVNILKKEITQYHDSNGYVSYSTKEKKYVILGTNSPKKGLAECPECKIGQLIVIVSTKTRKRFIGCSNYQAGGCTATSPLLQRARLRIIKKICQVCRWPIVIFRYSNNQKWVQQCTNINCTTRKDNSSNK